MVRLIPAVAVWLCASVASAFVEGNCAKSDSGLSWLAPKLSPGAAISCLGSPLQQYNAGRYWGQQYGKNAGVVVFPLTSQDVSYAVQAAALSPLGVNFAFVSGAHSMTNASSSTGFVIDLSWMNSTQVLQNVKVSDTTIGTAVAYQGGAKWADVNAATAGSGYCAVGARVGNVGVGGFTTGGGIGFLAGPYGYAVDRLAAAEVVLMSGQIVNATKTNQYSDLFWALQGGGGQFGIVTKFYQRAAREPTLSQVTVWVVDNSTAALSRQNTVNWFNNNNDPYSLVYWALAYVQSGLTEGDYGIQNVVVGVQFGDPTSTTQADFNTTFTPLINGLNITASATYTLPFAYLTQIIDPFFPYGFRRGFYGPQTTKITTDYLAAITLEYNNYINSQLANNDFPASALWALQYMYPGLNGNLPSSDSATAWPHSVSAHQTLFSPAWSSASDDALVNNNNNIFNQITYKFQQANGAAIADYPNYISPSDAGNKVWGSNVARLILIKTKYDPLCRINQGRVFASPSCLLKGAGNIFP